MWSCCPSQKRAARRLSPNLLCAQMFNRSLLERYHWQADGRCVHWTGTYQCSPLTSQWCWVPAGKKGRVSQWLTAALRRATLSWGAGTAVVSPDLAVVKVTKSIRGQNSKLQLEVLSAASMPQHMISKYDILGGIWLPEDRNSEMF